MISRRPAASWAIRDLNSGPAGYKKAKQDGSGVYVVGDNMTDGPMIKKAVRVLDRAGVAY